MNDKGLCRHDVAAKAQRCRYNRCPCVCERPAVTQPTWIFDLDNTLHDADHGVFPHIDRMMTRFMMDKLGIGEHEASTLRQDYYQRYGATLEGLRRHHDVDPQEFLHATHPMDDFMAMLRWEADLAASVQRLPGRKFLLSNGPQHYVEGIVERMGIRHLFISLYGVDRVDYIPKPDPRAFEHVLAREKLNAADCIMVEDSLPNLQSAKRLGMRTVWIAAETRRPSYVDVRVRSIAELSRLSF